MHDRLIRPSLNVWHGLRCALLRPVPLTALLFTLVALVISPIVALCAAAATIVIVVLTMSRPSVWKEAARERDERWRSLPAAWTITDGRVREAVGAIEDAMREVRSLLPTLPPPVQVQLRNLGTGLDAVRACAADLVRRVSWLSEFARPERRERTERDLERLRDIANRTPQAGRSYAAAIRAREDQFRALLDIEAERERALANLEHLAAVVEALPHRIAGLCILNARYVDGVGCSLDEVLTALGCDLSASRAVLGETL